MSEVVSVKAYHCFTCHATRMEPFPEIPSSSGEYHHYDPNDPRLEPWCFGVPREVVIRTVEDENGG